MMKRHRFVATLCAVFVFCFCARTYASLTEDWEKASLRLSGESDRVYRDSVKRLKQTPGLNDRLLAALSEHSTRTYLALDVISTLKLEVLLPAVIKAAEKDDTGFFYLAINTFIDGAHLKSISDLYQERLKNRASSAPAKMVLLETLARLRVKIPEQDLQHYLEDSREPELQSAAHYYLRLQKVKLKGGRK